MVVNRSTFVKILDMIDRFWATRCLGEEIEKKILKVHTTSTYFIYSFLLSCMTSVAIFTIFPLMDRSLIYTGYQICDIKQSPCYELLYLWHVYLLTFVILPSSMAFDCSFICLVGRSYSAIELVKYSLNELIQIPHNFADRIILDRNIGRIIQQHDLILRCIKEMNKFYTGIVLTQFWTALGTLTFSLYMITSKGFPPDTTLLSKFGCLYVVVCGQLFLYTFGGTIIIEQTKSVAQEAFSADWYSKTESDLRYKLQFIIMRSHKYEKLTVGNMANLDLESFVHVLKNSLSIYTLLRTVEMNSEMDY